MTKPGSQILMIHLQLNSLELAVEKKNKKKKDESVTLEGNSSKTEPSCAQHSAMETEADNDQTLETPAPKKRTKGCGPMQWKLRERRRMLVTGEEYTTVLGKIYPAMPMREQ
ncbi:hypothetical protein PR048_023827 [Dryococelus australis]|uniref:Uncharacterized protein n=1 Tax=Dryococelus australis TaxID=614101 RepID=A0ABQ9GVC3_9NEOP|nr:hypothetical protein PR048_023827 [Dryococelus australis]